MEENSKEIKEIREDVSRILYHLESDPKMKKEGLVEQVNRIDDQLQELLTREKVYMGKLTVFALVGAAVVNILFKILGTFFKSNFT